MARYNRDSYENCSTVIVGKNASATGYVLIGHEEDDLDCISQLHKVPRMHHEEGEVITFPDGDAVVPQVPETYAYIWSEMRRLGGAPFADGFMNEWGVVIGTDSCVGTKESTQEHKTGLGYGMRRLIAERCKTAREGVEVAAQLMKDYGYRSTRSYHIADKNEAWAVQLTEGSNFVAQRIGDDEVYYIPNWLTIHQVDFTDTEHKNFYWSEDVVGYAIRNGWYTPAKEGDYSDFDFAAAYQGGVSVVRGNIDRSNLAWKQLVGEALPITTFSAKATRKYDMEDVKKLLRSHYMEYEEDMKENSSISPHRYGICRNTTAESFIADFAEEADLCVLWRAIPRPCTSPYVPWFCGMTKTAKGYAWMDVKPSQLSHLDPDAEEFQYHNNRAYWAFHRLMNLAEFDHHYCEELIQPSIEKLEKTWALVVPEVRESYRRLKAVDEEAAKEYLTDWTHAQAQKAWDWANQMSLDLVNKKNMDNAIYWRELYKQNQK